ncbi:mRNA turnover 4, variant 2, partial [Bonamia ostreae]
NKRNVYFNKIKNDWTDSKFFSGKNRLIQFALGKTTKREKRKNLHKFGKTIKNECVLLMTNKSVEEVKKYFNFVRDAEYAKSGTISTKTVELKSGLLENMPFSMETRLKELKLPIKLDNRQIFLLGDVTVCSKGEMLTSNQCAVLVNFGR